MSTQNLVNNPVFEVMVFGDEKCGKSTFLQKDKSNLQYTEDDVLKRVLTFNCLDKQITLNCLDKQGLVHPNLMYNYYYNCAIILLDLSKPIRDHEVFEYLSIIGTRGYCMKTFIIGNKKDLVQDESEELKTLKTRIQQMNLDYLETNSLQHDSNVFATMIQKLLRLNDLPILE
jgi:GTPase SAR1 family protein